jgi:hypothetical protein
MLSLPTSSKLLCSAFPASPYTGLNGWRLSCRKGSGSRGENGLLGIHRKRRSLIVNIRHQRFRTKSGPPILQDFSHPHPAEPRLTRRTAARLALTGGITKGCGDSIILAPSQPLSRRKRAPCAGPASSPATSQPAIKPSTREPIYIYIFVCSERGLCSAPRREASL